MTLRILIECGAAETRAALAEDGLFTQFHFGPARGDENLAAEPSSGDIVAGRVQSVSKSLNAAFVDIGAKRAAFLALKKDEKRPIEGARAVFIVRRPAIGEKGAVISAGWRSEVAPEAIAAFEKEAAAGRVGPLGPAADALVAGFVAIATGKSLGDIAVIANDPEARRLLSGYGARSIEICDQPFGVRKVDALIEESLATDVELPGGARMRFHETDAGVMIDIDASSSADGAGARLNDKTNAAAAARLMTELTRRGLGGRIVVDFLPPSDAAAQAALAGVIKAGLSRISGARFGALRKDGLADFTLPRRRLSLLEFASEPARDSLLRDGRRFTLDWAAKAAIRRLERTLIRAPSSSPRLIVGAEIAAYLERERPQWRERLTQRFGARFDIAAGGVGRGFDLVEETRL